jgi:hypothetical protein
MPETVSQTPFSELIKTAPEVNSPYTAKLVTGVTQQWPFHLVEQPDPHKAVFATEIGGFQGSPSYVTVSYEESHGLTAKRTVFYRQPEFSSQFLIEGREVKVKSGELEIVYIAALNSPFATEGILNNPNNFSPIISIKGSEVTIPPLAHAKFDPEARPVSVEFALADYDAAKKGDIEMRRGKFDNFPTYRFNYYFKNKNGRKVVGVTAFEDKTSTFAGREYSHFELNSSGWYFDGNGLRLLEGSNYAAKISDLNGQLRLARQNMQTGEVWMFSIPEEIQPQVFCEDIDNLSMVDFFRKYPASFTIKKKDEKPKWIRSS